MIFAGKEVDLEESPGDEELPSDHLQSIVDILKQPRMLGFYGISEEDAELVQRPEISIQVETVIWMLIEYLEMELEVEEDIRTYTQALSEVLNVVSEGITTIKSSCWNVHSVTRYIMRLKRTQGSLGLQLLNPVFGNDHAKMKESVKQELSFMYTKLDAAETELARIIAALSSDDRGQIALGINSLLNYAHMSLRLETEMVNRLKGRLVNFLPKPTRPTPEEAFLEG